ncbi:unnamed protein product [Symbiodinium sp. CCMP2456]|nr:unnamed protein product [Symbiodinium sp. CCMP2456]
MAKAKSLQDDPEISVAHANQARLEDFLREFRADVRDFCSAQFRLRSRFLQRHSAKVCQLVAGGSCKELAGVLRFQVSLECLCAKFLEPVDLVFVRQRANFHQGFKLAFYHPE